MARSQENGSGGEEKKKIHLFSASHLSPFFHEFMGFFFHFVDH